MISLLALAYAPPQQSRPAVRAPGARSRTPVLIAPDLAARVKEDGPGPLSSSDAASSPRKTSANEFVLNFPPRYPRLRDLSLNIRVRRTLEEAELALQLESEFNSDPSILNDIDFDSLQRRVERDMSSGNDRLLRAGLNRPSSGWGQLCPSGFLGMPDGVRFCRSVPETCLGIPERLDLADPI